MPSTGGPAGFTHIHGAVRDNRTGDVLVATHEGLFARAGSGWVRRGPVNDLMGFTIGPDGAYLASGHPGAGSTLPQPLGLIRSTDGGLSWTTLGRGGQSDFHALAAGPGLIAGYDGTLQIATSGETWSQTAIPSEPYALAISPAGRILATTTDGLLSSTDRGRTWTHVATPALLQTISFADATTITAGTTDGTLVQSNDGGATWRSGPHQLGPISALSSTRTGSGVQILAVVGAAVLATTDLGASRTTVA